MRAAPSSPPAAGTRSSLIATARQVPGVHGVAEVPAVLVLAAERGSLCAASPGTPFTSPAPFVQSKRTCAVLGFSFHESQAFVLLGGTLRYFFLKSLCEEKEQTVASSALGLSSLLGSLAGRGSWVGAVRKQESAAAPINLCVPVLLGLCHVGGAFGAGFPPPAAC